MRATDDRITRVAIGMPPRRIGSAMPAGQRHSRATAEPRGGDRRRQPCFGGCPAATARPLSHENVHLPFISSEILHPLAQIDSCYVISRITK
jgi:hypothetical protein